MAVPPRARIANQQAHHDHYASKDWVEDKLIRIVDIGLNGRPAKASENNPQERLARNPTLALSALMQLAKLKGYIVEKRSNLNAKVDLSKMPRAELATVLQGMLDQVDPGVRAKLEAQVKQIAAGTFDAETVEE